MTALKDVPWWQNIDAFEMSQWLKLLLLLGFVINKTENEEQ